MTLHMIDAFLIYTRSLSVRSALNITYVVERRCCYLPGTFFDRKMDTTTVSGLGLELMFYFHGALNRPHMTFQVVASLRRRHLFRVLCMAFLRW